jgi:hypothetical protein
MIHGDIAARQILAAFADGQAVEVPVFVGANPESFA